MIFDIEDATTGYHIQTRAEDHEQALLQFLRAARAPTNIQSHKDYHYWKGQVLRYAQHGIEFTTNNGIYKVTAA